MRAAEIEESASMCHGLALRTRFSIPYCIIGQSHSDMGGELDLAGIRPNETNEDKISAHLDGFEDALDTRDVASRDVVRFTAARHVALPVRYSPMVVHASSRSRISIWALSSRRTYLTR
jgi:hypothetical protein